jgi:hypothetical protein
MPKFEEIEEALRKGHGCQDQQHGEGWIPGQLAARNLAQWHLAP